MSSASRDQLRCECETTRRIRPKKVRRDATLTETSDRSHRDCESWIPRFKADRDGGSAASHLSDIERGALDPPLHLPDARAILWRRHTLCALVGQIQSTFRKGGDFLPRVRIRKADGLSKNGPVEYIYVINLD